MCACVLCIYKLRGLGRLVWAVTMCMNNHTCANGNGDLLCKFLPGDPSAAVRERERES